MGPSAPNRMKTHKVWTTVAMKVVNTNQLGKMGVQGDCRRTSVFATGNLAVTKTTALTDKL